MTNEEALAGFSTGITNLANVQTAIDRIPCGLATVEEAIKDTTNVQSNAPRAIMVVQYKGILLGLAVAERVAADQTPPERPCMKAYAGVAVDKIIRSFDGGLDNEWWELTDALRVQRREEWIRMVRLQMRACAEEGDE